MTPEQAVDRMRIEMAKAPLLEEIVRLKAENESLSAQLAAQDAARGEILKCCPNCWCFDSIVGPIPRTRKPWQCCRCGSLFVVPARYQRLLAPPRQPA